MGPSVLLFDYKTPVVQANRPNINDYPADQLEAAKATCKEREHKYISSMAFLIDVCFGGKALQLKDRMPVGSFLHRLSGTENQVLDVTLARLQACASMHTCSSVVAGVAATREAIFHGHSTSFVRPSADGKIMLVMMIMMMMIMMMMMLVMMMVIMM